MWWKKLFKGKSNSSSEIDDGKEVTEEKIIVAKCIGCGQCEQGCPVRVKVKVKRKKQEN